MASRSSRFVLLILAALNAFALDRFEAIEPHMGSMVRMVVYAKDSTQAREAFHDAFARVAQLDEILSDYKPESELNRLCVARSMIVSRDLFRVLDASQKLAIESDGAFDITAGPVIRLWREARKTHLLPDPELLQRAVDRRGFSKLTVDHLSKRATLAGPDMRLDVGGIAKGYVADEALAILKQHGIHSALVAASGDIAVSDPPPGKCAWDLTLELLGGTRDIHLRNAAVSTAGDTEQFMEIEGKRYSHIIDPKSGMALTRRIAVSVIAPTGLEADGLDTAISVLGPTRGLELLKRHPKAKAIIVTSEGAVETPEFGR